MPLVPLSASVGNGAANNATDVKLVKARLKQLGFSWVSDDVAITPEDIEVIRLFQAVKNGHSVVQQPVNDGRIDVGGGAHQWLQAANAPHWLLVREWSSRQGFVKAIDGDEHDYGVNWLADTIVAASARYRDVHLFASPNAALVTVNDISLPFGGPTDDHAGHETGLMCDVKLPRTNGQTGGITYQDPTYDQSATRAMIEAFNRQPHVSKVYFNDPVLIAENLCESMAGHDNHVHFQITPPQRMNP